jgi:hypothetical protein
MKPFSRALLVILGFAGSALSAQTIQYLSDDRSVTANATKVGGAGPWSASSTVLPSSAFVPTTLQTSASVQSAGATATQISSFGTQELSFYASSFAWAYASQSNGAQSAQSYASSIFSVTFTVSSESLFNLTADRSVNYLGNFRLSGGGVDLVDWQNFQASPNSLAASGVLAPGIVYTLWGAQTGVGADYLEFLRVEDSFSANIAAALKISSVPESGSSLLVFSMALIGLASAFRFPTRTR